MKKLLVIASLLLLSACASTPDIVIPPGAAKPITLNPTVLELCVKLKKLPENATFDIVLSTTADNIEAYGICADKQRVSVELIKQLANKKDK